MTYEVAHFINGKSVSCHDRSLEIIDPTNAEVIGHVLLADKKIIEQAIIAATQQFPAWSATTPLKRARILFKFKALLEENMDELAALITKEHGKILNDARGSIQRGIDVVEYACGIPNLLKGTYSEEVAPDIDSYSVRQPIGVSVGITPFNFPAMIGLWMFPLAIACGNTFIWKPSEKDPSCSILIAELAKKAGLPDGVLNVVQGDKIAVDLLLSHPDVNTISFVGSTPVAEHVYKTAIMHGKRAQAFGGAKNHGVVLSDADMEQAVDSIIGAAYGSAGERCMAISVVIAVGDHVADQLIEKMVPKIKNLKIGKGTEANTEMGPLVSQMHLDKVKAYIEIGKKEGAKLVVDGSQFKPDRHEKGFFMGACLFDQVTAAMRIYREEIFGPVLSIVRVANLDEAIKLINAHEYGNGAAIFTNNGNAARTFAHQVKVGMVGINVPVPVPVAFHSFGGWKRSLFGDIHMHGPEAIQFFTKLKTITQRWPQQKYGSEFSMPTH